MPTQPHGTYIPALHYAWLTLLYDPVIAWTTREATFKRALLAQARIQPGQRVLDLGCGTATLTIALKQTFPDTLVVGLDGDAAILDQAKAKARRSSVSVGFNRGLSFALPYANESFDRVLSSLFFHHLALADKRRTFVEIGRVLKPGAELHVADWGPPQNALMRVAFLGVQLLDGFTTTNDNMQGLLPTLMREGGLEDIQMRAQYATLFGTMSLYQARKPLSPTTTRWHYTHGEAE
jgi:SAM-dependent methyltransferase